MVQIVNPYKYGSSTLGDAIRRAGNSMFGDTLTPALKREQLLASQRENTETENLMREVATSGDLDWSFIAPAMIGAGYKPGDFNDLVLGRAANMHGARDQRTQNAQIGAGKAFSSTAEAFDIGEATKRRDQDIASGDRRYGYDLASGDRRYGYDLASGDRRRGQDLDDARHRREQDLTDARQRYGYNIASGDRRYGYDLASDDRRRGQDLDDARHRYEFDNTPEEAFVNGEPVFVPRSGVFEEGVSPVLSSTERGAAAKFNEFNELYLDQFAVDPANPTPEEADKAKQYAIAQVSKSKGRTITTGPDGGVTIEEGGPAIEEGGPALGDLTNNVRSGMQKQSIAAEDFNRTADIATEYLIDPANANLFGPVGKVRQIMQSGVEVGNNIALTFGYQDADEMAEDLRQEVARNGVAQLLPEIYDPNLDAVDAVWGLLIYKGAAALAGQEGRSVSDKDVQFFREIFGGPKGLFSSQKSLAAKMDIARRMVRASQAVRDNAMANRPLGEGRDENPGSSRANPVDLTDEAEAEALPPGTWVRMGGRVGQVE